MAEASEHNNYSFEDIQRYLQGKMSAAEMHAIEKAALQDPFLADALEGYAEVPAAIAKEHLNQLNASLTGEKKTSKIVAFNRKSQWLSVAALIIILAGTGIIISYFLRSPEKQQVAQVKKETIDNNIKDSASQNAAPALAKQDTVLIIAENKNLKKAAGKKTKARPSIIEDSNISQDEARIAIVSAAPATGKQNESVTLASENARPLTITNDTTHQNLQGRASGIEILPTTFSGKVIDENNKPVAGAYIETADKKVGTVTDMDGNFSLQKTDTLLNVTTSTVGYERQKSYLKAGNNEPIVLKPSGAELNEVVVVGYGTKRKKDLSAQTTPLPDSAMPVGGWQNFNKYVLSRLNKDTTTEAITDRTDIVEMEFLIDKNGDPSHIKITRSLDKQRDAQAVDILRSGPKWKTTSRNQKTKIAINF